MLEVALIIGEYQWPEGVRSQRVVSEPEVERVDGWRNECSA